MGHALNAIIGKAPATEHFASRWVLASPLNLPQGLRLIPLTVLLHDDIDALVNSREPDPFEELPYLSASAAEAIAQSSHAGALAYIETDYFGSVGSQAAVLWDKGRIRIGPHRHTLFWNASALRYEETGVRAINLVLKNLGVWCKADQDEFDAIGLSRFRSTHDL